MNMTVNFDKESIFVKEQKLRSISDTLKSEFFGIDNIIDRVVTLIRPWYLMPEIITRPVIINLWGLTGVGKTQLVRRLTSLLNYSNRFVEIQMDGISTTSASKNTIYSILSNSSIEEGQTGILLLDEIQRYRTIDTNGSDAKVERFQDVWMLLSDGKFSSNSEAMKEIEMMLASQLYWTDQGGDDDDDDDDPKPQKVQKIKKFFISPYEARRYKKLLRLTEDVQQIMTWSGTQLFEAIDTASQSNENMEIDYSKILIFISGNLDEMFQNSFVTSDSDTNADVFYEMSKNLKINDVKEALLARFKPEQISRFGNNHIIYPSMNKITYQQIIKSACEGYINEMRNLTNIQFRLNQTILDEIYLNSVFPSQGTRPVFSTIHQILGTSLSVFGLWALENDIKLIDLDIDTERKVLIARSGDLSYEIPVYLDIRSAKEKDSEDFNTVVSVHEIGHAIVYAKLFKKAPKEVKINLATFKGGYMIPMKDEFDTKKDRLNMIAVLLAGSIAESYVFGEDNRSTGNSSDMYNATNLASTLVRKLGMGTTKSFFIHPSHDGDTAANSDVSSTNSAIESILSQADRIVRGILDDHKELIVDLTTELLNKKEIQEDRFIEVCSPYFEIYKEQRRYTDAWKSFKEKTTKEKVAD